MSKVLESRLLFAMPLLSFLSCAVPVLRTSGCVPSPPSEESQYSSFLFSLFFFGLGSHTWLDTQIPQWYTNRRRLVSRLELRLVLFQCPVWRCRFRLFLALSPCFVAAVPSWASSFPLSFSSFFPHNLVHMAWSDLVVISTFHVVSPQLPSLCDLAPPSSRSRGFLDRWRHSYL